MILAYTGLLNPPTLEHLSNGGIMRDKDAVVRRIARRLLRYYRRWFRNRNHIFVHREPFDAVSVIQANIVRYDCFEDVPAEVMASAASYGGQCIIEEDRREVEMSAVMWVAFIGERLAGVSFTRRGRHFKGWFAELQDNDIVIFRMRTYPKYCGRGIAPLLMRHAMSSLLQRGDLACIDCRVYNKPSIRSIHKAGFERFATMKPIARETALGPGATEPNSSRNR